MYDKLTGTQQVIYDLISDNPLTASEIADEMGYSSTSVVYDHISGMRERGIVVNQNNGGGYVIDGKGQPVNSSTMRRQNTVSQQTITKKANEYFAELEQIVKPRLKHYDPPVADGGLVYREGNVDLIIHLTDTHIGDLVHKAGRTQFDSDIAVHRIKQVFDQAYEYAGELEELGYEVDTVHLLLGGDIVTNEAIYNQQPWDVDDTINGQIQTAVKVLDNQIARLAERFPSLQIVCQNGNHGEFRVDGSSGQANADDFVYSILDYLIRKSEYENITVIKDEHEWHVDFKMRSGKWTGQLRHGQKTRGHIGTSSPRDDWQAWQRESDFDVAFYGHHHQYKEEPLPDGTPVIMGGSIKPPDDFAAGMASFSGPMTAVHAVSDEQVLRDTRRIEFQ